MIQWDDYWKNYSVSKAEKWLILERNKTLNDYLDKIDKPIKKVIEIGCGYGSNIHLLKKGRADVECHALDNSKVSVDLVQKKIDKAIMADCRNTTLPDDTYDVIFSAGLMEHFVDEIPLLNEWKRILAPGGFIVTFVPAKYSLWQLYQFLHFGNWQHGYEKAYTANALRDLHEKNGFKIVDIIGNDPFSINGFLMKFFNISFNPFWKRNFCKSGYTELCVIVQK